MSSWLQKAKSDHFVAPDQLRIGLFIHIDLPWFRHPFTLSSFRISSDEQIQELRALKLAQLRYDPERSEGALHGTAEDGTLTPLAEPAAGSPEVESIPPPLQVTIDPRVEQLREHRAAILRTEKSFIKALGVMRRLDRSLLSSPGETLEEMDGLVAQMVTVFVERPEVTLQVMGENCGGEEAYHHGLNVSILCMMLVRELALSGEQAGMLGLGALLHDIGLMEIPDRVVKKSPDEQSRPERDLRARHVEYGIKLGRRLGLSADVLSILEQHHEMADGSGYPRGILLEQIAPLARIVSLVNYYENLCNPVDFAQAMTPHEALSFIFSRRKSQFDGRILQLMIRSLGVYPPGSVVMLSNEAIAMVISVNPHKTLRPWVLLYDATRSREDALMLNLETESNLNIRNAIRPAILPAPIRAFLSPRRRITYFFDGGPSPTAGQK